MKKIFIPGAKIFACKDIFATPSKGIKSRSLGRKSPKARVQSLPWGFMPFIIILCIVSGLSIVVLSGCDDRNWNSGVHPFNRNSVDSITALRSLLAEDFVPVFPVVTDGSAEEVRYNAIPHKFSGIDKDYRIYGLKVRFALDNFSAFDSFALLPDGFLLSSDELFGDLNLYGFTEETWSAVKADPEFSAYFMQYEDEFLTGTVYKTGEPVEIGEGIWANAPVYHAEQPDSPEYTVLYRQKQAFDAFGTEAELFSTFSTHFTQTVDGGVNDSKYHANVILRKDGYVYATDFVFGIRAAGDEEVSPYPVAEIDDFIKEINISVISSFMAGNPLL